MNPLPSLDSYAAIGITILMVLIVIVAMLILAHVVGPRRHGPVKDSPYESGMPVSTDARRRFHIRFFVVAILFMLFDVEVIFLWPWAALFHQSATTGATIPMEGGGPIGKDFLL